MNKTTKWTVSEIALLLQAMEPHRAAFRGRFVDESVWDSIQGFLNGKITRDTKQVKTKVKTLKSNYKSAKEGELGGTDWPHLFKMRFIFEDPLHGTVSLFSFLICCAFRLHVQLSSPLLCLCRYAKTP